MKRSLCIVVADDNDDVRLALCEALALIEHVVHQATNGREAIRVILEVEPDVAILDIGMPEVDGLSVAREIRLRLGPKRPRLVAHSGFTRALDHEHARVAGFDAYVDKPAELACLLEALTEG